MKTLVKLLLLLALSVYLVMAFFNFTQHRDTRVCSSLHITITDSTHAAFISAAETERLLKAAHLYPVGKQMDEIDGLKIEETLKKNSVIEDVQCYKAPNGVVNVLITQRMPLMRIMASNGNDYYIDSKGHVMRAQNYVADVVVATGDISPRFARKELVQLGQFLQNDAFWSNQIEQIYVDNGNKIKLVPRVGGHVIDFGTADSIAQKFRNLHTFYQKVLPQVGWNKYNEISVEHVSQIVGRKPQGKS